MTLDYVWKDVFRSARLGFSPKKIWVATKGIIYGVIGYSIISYIALLTSGWTVKEIWHAYRYIPFPIFQANLNWYSWVIWGIAILWALFYYFVTLTAVSKITHEQLKGDEFYESKEAWNYAYKNWKGTFLSPVYLVFFIVALLVAGLILGLVGRIPHVGQILIGLTAIPIISGALFIVYLTIVLGVILLTAPAIVAATESDTFDTLFEGFSLINDQTWRFLLWELLVIIVAFLGIVIFGWLLHYALTLTYKIVGVWAGPRPWWSTMWHNARWYLHMPWLPMWIAKFYPSFHAPIEFIAAGSPSLATAPGVTTSFGGFLLGLSFYLLIFIVMGYGVSTFSAGQSLIYTILVKIKDEKDILEEEEELFEGDLEEESMEEVEEIEEEEEEEIEEEEEEEEEK